ncbi:MAG: quinone-dependent dihydroorotate dehydrogenase [Coxiellaceae bacterium]|nr:quinone-dependent dihydroorotate dehydrogenase [Coxiellaceae bacterium]
MHKFFLKFLLCLPPEFSHHLALFFLKWFYPASCAERLRKKLPKHPVQIAGLNLPNPVGLAAGLDKDARCIDAWFAMGFGFVEVGTVTPKPQSGNPKPRLFRLKKYKALINRMGFNNQGVDALVKRLKRRRVSGVLGVNIGKNRDTPLERAVDDYRYCLEKVYPCADYVTVNISSPNTPGLRELQGERYLEGLLAELVALRNQLNNRYDRKLPLFVKIAPDLSEGELHSTLSTIEKQGIDAIIATNTSIKRDSITAHPLAKEVGGLSGEPIYQYAKSIVVESVKFLQGRIPVIAVGGVSSPERAKDMMAAGASAVQVYSAFIYQGPELIRKIIKSL